jgi:hypothetical protein
MSVTIKWLSNTAPTPDKSCPEFPETFNLIDEPNRIFDLYVAEPRPTPPATTPVGKYALVKSIRLVNAGSSVVTVNLYVMRPEDPSKPRYLLKARRRYVLRVDMRIEAGRMKIHNSEIALEPGDRIQGEITTDGKLYYLISGLEREAS